MGLSKSELRYLTGIIQKEVSSMNGWSVSEDQERELCENAAKKVMNYLEKKFFKYYRSNA